jgi:hypothetical protein
LAAVALLSGALAVPAVAEVLAQLPLVVPQLVAIGGHLLLLGRRLGAVLLELLPVLLELLEVRLQLGGVARGHIGLNLLPIGFELLAGLELLVVVAVQGLTILGQLAPILLDRLPLGLRALAVLMRLLFVIVQGMTIVVPIVVGVLDRMGLLVLGLGISREPDQPCDGQRHHYMLHHCPLLRKELCTASEPLSSDWRTRTARIRLAAADLLPGSRRKANVSLEKV